MAAGIYLMDVDQSATLVHGLPTLQRPPFEKFGHAWIEYRGVCGTMVLEVANGQYLRVPVSHYYEVGKIDPVECKRYALADLRRWATTFKHWGPWEPEECNAESDG